MPKATSRNTILTVLDVIAPRRERFNVINGGLRLPQNSTVALIERLAAEMAAKHGAPIQQPKKGPRNPHVNHYGKITDPEQAAMWEMVQRNGGVK